MGILASGIGVRDLTLTEALYFDMKSYSDNVERRSPLAPLRR